MIDNTAKRAEAGKKAEEGKALATGAANAASGQAKATAEKLASSFSNLKGDISGMLKGLKDSLGIPDIPKIPKKPAFKELKKFKPKTPPEPKVFQKEEKKFEYAKVAPITTPAPIKPKGEFSYKYEFFPGKKPRISVGLYDGNRYASAVASLSFTTNVTEEYAIQSFIKAYKASYPTLESWGIKKL